MSEFRTSRTSPLQIAMVAVAGGGRIGLTICPGKRGESKFGSPWRRDLNEDLQILRMGGVSTLVTLMEDEEMRRLGVPNLGLAAQQAGMEWVHLPLRDGETPNQRFENSWLGVAPWLIASLRGDRTIAIHCRGGLGRTGLVACLLLIETGESPSSALARVRAARPGAVETREQEAYVLDYRPDPRIADWLEEAALDAEELTHE